MIEWIANRKSGRGANGNERDHGVIYHAVPRGTEWGMAACGTTPGRRSIGWSCVERDVAQVNCPACLRRLRSTFPDC